MEVFILLLLLVQAIVFGAFCAFVAGQKNRGRGNWFILGFLFSFLSLLALIAVPKNESTDIIPASSRKCPFCAEVVKAEAKICRYCNNKLPAIKKSTRNHKVRLNNEDLQLDDELSATHKANWSPQLESLETAVIKGDVSKISLLVSQGIDVHIPNEDGISPIQMAHYYENQEIIDILDQSGSARGREAYGRQVEGS